MPRKRLPMRHLRESLRLRLTCGLSHRAIARALSMGVGTVCTHLRRAEQAGLDWERVQGLDDGRLEALLHPGGTKDSPGRPEPDWAHIHRELRRAGVTLQLLWLEHVEAHPDGHRYSQFCERYRRWAKKLNPTMRQRHRAGEKTFVDFSGTQPEIVDRRTGEVRKVELFVAALGASSRIYAEACESQQLHDWIDVHIHMVEYLGGSTRIWVPDNLKSGVTRPCRYEPAVNRTYDDLAKHYSAVVIPARARKPRDKAKAEVSVQIVQRWILARLRNHTFFSIGALNAAIRELLADLDERPMKTLGVSRRTLFEQLDGPALLPLPPTRYEMAYWKPVTVNIDYHVEVEKNYYSVPYQLFREKVEARYTASTVEVLYRDRRVASHARLSGRGRHVTLPEHMPSSHRAHAEWTPSRIIRWASRTGAAAEKLVTQILEDRPHPEQGFRSCLGLLRLGTRYGTERLEAACQRARWLRSPNYQTVKNILATQRDREPLPEQRPARSLPAHENVRGADFYAAKETRC